MDCLVEIKDGMVFCDTSMIAKKFGIKHNKVISVCDSLLSDLEMIKGTHYNPLIIKENREYRGAEFTAYMMDRCFFSLLCMRFRGVSALEWQIKFNDAFYVMEKSLLNEIKAPETMQYLNDLTKKIESDKDIASHCGKELSKYKRIKKENEEKWIKSVNSVQKSFGF